MGHGFRPSILYLSNLGAKKLSCLVRNDSKFKQQKLRSGQSMLAKITPCFTNKPLRHLMALKMEQALKSRCVIHNKAKNWFISLLKAASRTSFGIVASNLQIGLSTSLKNSRQAYSKPPQSNKVKVTNSCPGQVKTQATPSHWICWTNGGALAVRHDIQFTEYGFIFSCYCKMTW